MRPPVTADPPLRPPARIVPSDEAGVALAARLLREGQVVGIPTETVYGLAGNAFDEGAFSRLFIRHKSWPKPLQRLANACNSWRRCSEFIEAFSTPNGRIAWHDGSVDFPRRWVWRHGKLLNDRDGERDFPYFHFIGWKCDAWPAYSENELLGDATLAVQDAWSITPQGFREV